MAAVIPPKTFAVASTSTKPGAAGGTVTLQLLPDAVKAASGVPPKLTVEG
jgi:hypothetical protein